MKIQIDYLAAYAYHAQVSLSPHSVRVFPRGHTLTRIQDLSFTCSGGATIQFRRDLYDNEMACCFFPVDAHAFEISLHAILDVTPHDPLDFLLDSDGLTIPPNYSDAESAWLKPYRQTPSPIPLPYPLAPTGERPTVDTLMAMVRWMNEHIGYERRDEGVPFSPTDLLARGQGTCRDFTALLVEALRQNGVAARLVSGYLWEEKSAGRRVADDALHAWVEAYLPGAGWIGLDPTNGVFCDHHAIPTAVGLTPEDISPVSGTYYGHQTIPSRLTTRLRVEGL